MLNKTDFEIAVNKILQGSDKFLLELTVSPNNIVDVTIDGDRGISIGECAAISREIESMFDREIEDYELRVSSPGLDRPLVLPRQFARYLNRGVRVEMNDGRRITGILLQTDDLSLTIKVKGDKKKPGPVTMNIPFRETRTIKPEISFKQKIS